jgi:hypothetical protein
MVAKIKVGKSIMGVLNYNEQKVREHKAECISANLFGREVQGLTFPEKVRRFTKNMELNLKTKTNTIHISLNFDPSEKLNKELLNQIADDYMNRIGFGDQPYLVYKHNDAAHPHIHLVSTNIRSDGSRIDLHNIGRTRSEAARKEIESAYNLVKASEHIRADKIDLKPLNIEEVTYGKTETKRGISNVLSYVLTSYKVSSLPELNAILKQFNVMADRGPASSRMYLSKGLNYSLIDAEGRKQGVPIKASSIYQKPTLGFLEQYFIKCKESKQPLKHSLKNRIQSVLAENPSMTRQAFFTKLQSQNIQGIFYTNEKGLTYGLTFIDHLQKVVFTGSDLGKEMTAKAIIEKLVPERSTFFNSPAQRFHHREHQNHVTPMISGVMNSMDSQQDVKGFLNELLAQGNYDPSPSRLWKRKKRKKRINI